MLTNMTLYVDTIDKNQTGNVWQFPCQEGAGLHEGPTTIVANRAVWPDSGIPAHARPMPSGTVPTDRARLAMHKPCQAPAGPWGEGSAAPLPGPPGERSELQLGSALAHFYNDVLSGITLCETPPSQLVLLVIKLSHTIEQGVWYLFFILALDLGDTRA